MPDDESGLRQRAGAGLPATGSCRPARQGIGGRPREWASGLAAAILLAGSGLPYCPAATASDAGVVSVQITGLRNDRGVIKAALYNSSAQWSSDRGPGAGGAMQLQEAPINAGKATLRFTGVPYGRYALRAFHDEDRSGTLPTGPFGIPRVDVIFSNDVPIWQGLAPFDKASFPVNAPLTSLVLRAQRI